MKIIKNIIYGIVIIFLLAIISAILISKLETPISFKIFSVISGSMEPSIQAGSIVLVKEEDAYVEGDVITYQLENSSTPVTHRIVKTELQNNENIYYTKGDANNVEDNIPIKENSVIGRVFFNIPLLGYPFTFVNTQLGFILLVIIPATLIIVSELWNVKTEVRNILKKDNDKTVS